MRDDEQVAKRIPSPSEGDGERENMGFLPSFTRHCQGGLAGRCGLSTERCLRCGGFWRVVRVPDEAEAFEG